LNFVETREQAGRSGTLRTIEPAAAGTVLPFELFFIHHGRIEFLLQERVR